MKNRRSQRSRPSQLIASDRRVQVTQTFSALGIIAELAFNLFDRARSMRTHKGPCEAHDRMIAVAYLLAEFEK